MAVTIVGILGLLIFGFIALAVVTLLVVMGARAIGGKKGAGGGLAAVAVSVALLLFVFVFFLYMTRVSHIQTVNHHANGGASVSVVGTPPKPDAPDGHPHGSNLRVNPQQFAVQIEDAVIANASSLGAMASAQGSSLTVAGNPWTDAVEEFQDFEADVYPSLEAAAEALGRRVGARLAGIYVTPDSEPKPVYIWRKGFTDVVYSHTVMEEDSSISRRLLDSVASGIRQKIGDPRLVSVEQAPTGNRASYTQVDVAFQEIEFDHHNRWGTQAEFMSGALAVRVDAGDEKFSVSTRFIEAPWVDDRTGFAADYPNGDWLVGYSDGTHTSHNAARQDAILAASNAVLPLAQARINRLSAWDQHRFSEQMAKDPDWLRNKVADELVSRNLATDRFAQRFDRPYGTVWREAVLVDASPDRVEQIARSLVQGLGSQVAYQRASWFSFAALLALVFGTYLFLNFATKGYYAWTLRFAAAAGIVVAVFLVRALG